MVNDAKPPPFRSISIDIDLTFPIQLLMKNRSVVRNKKIDYFLGSKIITEKSGMSKKGSSDLPTRCFGR